jgi:hypothetical protein
MVSKEEIEKVRVLNLVIKAANDAYHDHERSTSDRYLKSRVRNATQQVVERTALALLGEDWVKEHGYHLRPWNVTVSDVLKAELTINPLKAAI